MPESVREKAFLEAMGHAYGHYVDLGFELARCEIDKKAVEAANVVYIEHLRKMAEELSASRRTLECAPDPPVDQRNASHRKVPP